MAAALAITGFFAAGFAIALGRALDGLGFAVGFVAGFKVVVVAFTGAITLVVSDILNLLVNGINSLYRLIWLSTVIILSYL